jgi:hypothetical protein
MPLKMYLDGSMTDGVVMTLGSVVADEGLWSELEPAWGEVLNRHRVGYSHMKELSGGVGPFAGWNAVQRESFVYDLVAVLERFGPSDRIRQYACWVDLRAHAKWHRVRNHPSPERLCARILFPTFVHDYPGIIDAVEVWFDQGERFMTHLREDWQNPKVRKRAPVWALVRTVEAGDMSKMPALQVADLIAWSRNRFEVSVRPVLGSQHGIDAFSVAAGRVLNHGLGGQHREVGETAMAESTFGEEGLRRLRLFEQARQKHI